MLDGLVRARELSEVVASHLGLDFDRVEYLSHNTSLLSIPLHRQTGPQTHLAVVDTNDRANHLGDDDHVTEVSLHDRGLVVRGRLLLRLAKLLDQTHRLALETALEPPAGTSVDDLVG